jgi:drug/metabolite transporter (DMT)-like permease
LTIASAIFLAIAWFQRDRIHNATTPRDRIVLACAGGALAIHFATWIWSLEYTTVAVSTLVVCSTPVWTALYDAIFRSHHLSRSSLIAFVCGGIGLVMVVGFDHTQAPQPHHQVLGVGLAFVGSLAIGAYLILVQNVRDRLDTQSIVTRTYGWAALALLVAAAVAHQPPPAFHASAAWGGIIAMALVSQVIGHTAINASLRWFTPSAISFATLLEPVFAGILALIVFAEPIPPPAIFGAIVLLGSIGVVLRDEGQNWTSPAP